jgi:hypothetical protein
MSDTLGNGGADFGGSVEAAGGPSGNGGIGGGNGFGGGGISNGAGGNGGGGSSSTSGSGDFGLGGPGAMTTTAADWGALSTLAATGIFAGYGMTGWSGATFAMANQIAASFGTTLDTALSHLATDIANSTAWGGLQALSSGQ